jgi:hypothetical protein
MVPVQNIVINSKYDISELSLLALCYNIFVPVYTEPFLISLLDGASGDFLA